jgi:hypothetical protein
VFRKQDAYNEAVDATNGLLNEICYTNPDMPVYHYVQNHSHVGRNFRIEEHMRGQNVRIRLDDVGLQAFRKRIIRALHLHRLTVAACATVAARWR